MRVGRGQRRIPAGGSDEARCSLGGDRNVEGTGSETEREGKGEGPGMEDWAGETPASVTPSRRR